MRRVVRFQQQRLRLMRPIHSSESAAASRKPRARSIAVSAPVTGCVIVKRGAKAVTAQVPSKGAVLEGGEEPSDSIEDARSAVLWLLHRCYANSKLALQIKSGEWEDGFIQGADVEVLLHLPPLP